MKRLTNDALANRVAELERELSMTKDIARHNKDTLEVFGDKYEKQIIEEKNFLKEMLLHIISKPVETEDKQGEHKIKTWSYPIQTISMVHPRY